MPVFASQGTEVTVYRFKMFDIRSGEFVESRRWAPEKLIGEIGAKRIGEGVRTDAGNLADDGLTPHGFDPRPRTGGFQTSVPMTPRS